MIDRRADRLIVGRIATLAGVSGFAWEEAVAIADGRVIATGPAGELEPLCDRSTVRWRLGPEEAVVPAITDAHLHLALVARARRQADLSDQGSLDAYLRSLAVAHARLEADGNLDGWLLGHGWSADHAGGWPTADDIERVCPGRPVALWAHDHHSRWVSLAALRHAGISRTTTDPEGGLIRRDAAGEPTGMLHETAAGMVERFIPRPGPDELEADIVAIAAELAAVGVVGCHDPGELDTKDGGASATGHDVYRAMAGGGRLPLRVHASIRDYQLDDAIAAGWRSADRIADRYRMGWLKLFSDGSLGSRSAALLEPYTDAGERPPTGGPSGMLLHAREELTTILRRAWDGGIATQVHAIGDAAVRLALDLLADHPTLPLLPRVEHAQLIHPADVARFGALGIVASVQPVHLRTDAPIARHAWGDRAEWSIPLARLLAGGALIPFGTDAPVEPFDPWPGIAVAVARRDPFRPDDEPLGAGEAIDLARALRAACLDPALVAGEQDRGRLVAGHRADLLVVPASGFQNPMDAAVLSATRPLATLLDGEIVYRASAFDPG